MIVALIYNLKPEAPTKSSPAEAQAPTNRDSHFTFFGTDNHQRQSNDIYAEWDSIETIEAVRSALEERYVVLMIEANSQATAKLLENRPDFAFNIAEGLHGRSREAQIPAILEMLRIPYLGSDPLTLAVCLDKSRAKEILSYHGIPTAPFVVVDSVDGLMGTNVRLPSVVKPLHEGSSKGIYNSSVVRNMDELTREVRLILRTYNEPAIVEEFLPGREFTVAMLGNGDDVRILPIVEISFDALPAGVNHIYSYEAKWIWDTTERPLNIFTCPASIDATLRGEIENICRGAYRILNCRDWSRIDMRLDGEGRPDILEVNPLPGILPKPEDNSCFPKAARAAGMSYNQLINTVLDIAMKRCGVAVPSVQNGAVAIV